MKITIKNRIYLTIIMGMSVGICFASSQPDKPGIVPGGYGIYPHNPNVAQWPLEPGKNLSDMNSMYTNLQGQSTDGLLAQTIAENELLKKQNQEVLKQNQTLFEQNQKLLEDQRVQKEKYQVALNNLKSQQTQSLSQPKESQQKMAEYRNCGGINADKIAIYSNATYLFHSFFKTFPMQFYRRAHNSGLVIIRCGNTYKDLYIEDNINTTLLNLSLFNTYEKGMTINNTNSGRLSLSIGDFVHTSDSIDSGNDTNSTHLSIPISRKVLGALCVGSLIYKFNLLHTLLSGGTIIPKIVLGNTFLLVGAGVLIPIAALGVVIILVGKNFKIR